MISYHCDICGRIIKSGAMHSICTLAPTFNEVQRDTCKECHDEVINKIQSMRDAADDAFIARGE